MSKTTLTVTVRLKWWFAYLYWPILTCCLAMVRVFAPDAQPNWVRLEYWLKKAVVIETQNTDSGRIASR